MKKKLLKIRQKSLNWDQKEIEKLELGLNEKTPVTYVALDFLHGWCWVIYCCCCLLLLLFLVCLLLFNGK